MTLCSHLWFVLWFSIYNYWNQQTSYLALRITNSPRYLIPFPCMVSGFLTLRTLAVNWPSASLSYPVRVITFFYYFSCHACGNSQHDWWENPPFKNDFISLHFCSVTNSFDFKNLSEPFSYTSNHISSVSSVSSPQSLSFWCVTWWKSNCAIGNNHIYIIIFISRVSVAFVLGPSVPVRKRHSDAGWNSYWEFFPIDSYLPNDDEKLFTSNFLSSSLVIR